MLCPPNPLLTCRSGFDACVQLLEQTAGRYLCIHVPVCCHVLHRAASVVYAVLRSTTYLSNEEWGIRRCMFVGRCIDSSVKQQNPARQCDTPPHFFTSHSTTYSIQARSRPSGHRFRRFSERKPKTLRRHCSRKHPSQGSRVGTPRSEWHFLPLHGHLRMLLLPKSSCMSTMAVAVA